MLMHLVCFKYKTDVDPAARAEHRARLETLKSLDGIVDLKVGADVVRASRSYDTGLCITFTDRAALDTYARDPRHVPVAQLGIAISEHVVACDFEI
jgi:hypothetical protein